MIDPTFSVRRGRVVKRTGDGGIVEIRGVVDAVQYAIEVAMVANMPTAAAAMTAAASQPRLFSHGLRVN
jgi:hypothetical protein